MVMVYYGARMQTEVSEGNAHRAKSREDQLLVVLSQCRCADFSPHRCCQPGKLTRALVSGMFIGDCSIGTACVAEFSLNPPKLVCVAQDSTRNHIISLDCLV